MAMKIKFNMVQFNHLFTMMYKRVYIFIILLLGLLLLSCNKEEVEEKCTIIGSIIGSGIHPNGVKVVFENISDPSLKYIAISDVNGAFEFLDVVAGTYSVDALKEDLKWGWMTGGQVINQYDRLISLQEGQTKELIIYMMGSSYSSSFHLDLTDINGSPVGNSVSIPKYATTVAFRLYNGTNSNHSWEVSNTDRCFVSDDIGYEMEYIFESFSQTSGTLKPGDSVVLVGTINQKIFSVFQSSPRYSSCILDFYSDFSRKEVYLDIEF